MMSHKRAEAAEAWLADRVPAVAVVGGAAGSEGQSYLWSPSVFWCRCEVSELSLPAMGGSGHIWFAPSGVPMDIIAGDDRVYVGGRSSIVRGGTMLNSRPSVIRPGCRDTWVLVKHGNEYDLSVWRRVV